MRTLKQTLKMAAVFGVAASCILAAEPGFCAQTQDYGVPGEVGPKPILAQKLMQVTLLYHPDLNNCTIHAKTAAGMQIIASANDMRMVGRKSGEDDIKVLTASKPATEMETTLDQFEVLLPLKDGAGKVIGVLATVFKAVPIYNADDYIKKGMIIQAELAKQLPSEHELYKIVR